MRRWPRSDKRGREAWRRLSPGYPLTPVGAGHDYPGRSRQAPLTRLATARPATVYRRRPTPNSSGLFRRCLEEGSSMNLRGFRQGLRRGTQSVVIVSLVTMGMVGVDFAVNAGIAQASTITVNAVEDSYIDSSNPSSNFGTAVWLTRTTTRPSTDTTSSMCPYRRVRRSHTWTSGAGRGPATAGALGCGRRRAPGPNRR